MKLFKSLEKIDFFGVPYQVQTIQDKRIYQSKMGGISTVCIYALIMTYLVWNLRDWNNGSMVSKITTENTKILANSSSELMTMDIRMAINDYNDYMWAQPEDEQYFIIDAGHTGDMVPYIDGYFDTTLQFTALENGTISITNQINVNIYKCDPDFLLSGSCASEEQITNILTQRALYVSLYLNFTIINPNTFEKITISKVYWQGLDNYFCKGSTLMLDATQFHLQTGELFSEAQVTTQLTGVTYTIESQTQEYCKIADTMPGFPQNVLGFYFFSLDYISFKTTIQYPSFFDVLANIGAISQVILILKFAVYEYNHYSQSKEVVEILARALYPELGEIKVKSKFLRCQSVQLGDKEIEKESFFQFKQKLAVFIQKNISFHKIILNQFKLHHLLKAKGDNTFSGYRISMDHKMGQSSIIPHNLDDMPIFTTQQKIVQSQVRFSQDILSHNRQMYQKDRIIEEINIFSPNMEEQEEIMNDSHAKSDIHYTIPRRTEQQLIATDRVRYGDNPLMLIQQQSLKSISDFVPDEPEKQGLK